MFGVTFLLDKGKPPEFRDPNNFNTARILAARIGSTVRVCWLSRSTFA